MPYDLCGPNWDNLGLDVVRLPVPRVSGSSDEMRKFIRLILPLGLVILSIFVVAIMAGIAKSKRPERKQDGAQAILVETIIAEQRSLNFVVSSQGAVRPRTETTLVSEVSGKVVWVSPEFVAGGFFRRNQELLRIDPSDYEAALKRAEANLASRRARLADEQARSEQALKDWRNLGREGEPSELVLRKPQLQDAIANVSAAEADVQKARRDLERTRITVPYDGLLREKIVDVGQYVAPGTRLGVSFAIDSAEIRLPLSATDLGYLELPSATESGDHRFPSVTLFAEEGGETRSWQARIIRTEGVMDETSRVLYAVAQVVDPYGVLGQSAQEELRVGTFVRAEIEGKAADNVVVLPRHVLQNDNTVLVANQQNELEIRPVTVVRAEPRTVYLSSGVRGGERIVTTTLDAPIPGLKLTVNTGAGAGVEEIVASGDEGP
jgi:RND family efflux transporter MFP subunit